MHDRQPARILVFHRGLQSLTTVVKLKHTQHVHPASDNLVPRETRFRYHVVEVKDSGDRLVLLGNTAHDERVGNRGTKWRHGFAEARGTDREKCPEAAASLWNRMFVSARIDHAAAFLCRLNNDLLLLRLSQKRSSVSKSVQSRTPNGLTSPLKQPNPQPHLH
jgi:hypothetical protein